MTNVVEWCSRSLVKVPVILSVAAEEDVCNIFKEKINYIEGEEHLPAKWDVNGHTCNMARLECGHAYHASAIAMHFLMSDMRCPICRRGPHSKMLIDSIPKEIRGVFANYAANSEEVEDTAQPNFAIFDRQRMCDDWNLIVEVRNNAQRHFVCSRLIRTPDSLEIEPGVFEYSLQRSFRRNLLHCLQNLSPGQTTISFSLFHIAVGSIVHNVSMTLHELKSYLGGVINTRNSRSALKFLLEDQYFGRLTMPEGAHEQMESWPLNIQVYLHTEFLLSLCLQRLTTMFLSPFIDIELANL